MEHLKDTSPAEFKVWYFISEKCYKTGECELSYSTIMEDCNIKSSATVTSILNKLVELGLITKETHKCNGSKNSTNRFTSIARYDYKATPKSGVVNTKATSKIKVVNTKATSKIKVAATSKIKETNDIYKIIEDNEDNF